MTPTHSLTLPVDCRLLSLDEAEAVVCGASSSDDIEKISKVFNYMARIFSSTSSMLNNFITIYNTVKQLNEFIDNNF